MTPKTLIKLSNGGLAGRACVPCAAAHDEGGPGEGNDRK